MAYPILRVNCWITKGWRFIFLWWGYPVKVLIHMDSTIETNLVICLKEDMKLKVSSVLRRIFTWEVEAWLLSKSITYMYGVFKD